MIHFHRRIFHIIFVSRQKLRNFHIYGYSTSLIFYTNGQMWLSRRLLKISESAKFQSPAVTPLEGLDLDFNNFLTDRDMYD